MEQQHQGLSSETKILNGILKLYSIVPVMAAYFAAQYHVFTKQPCLPHHSANGHHWKPVFPINAGPDFFGGRVGDSAMETKVFSFVLARSPHVP